MKSSSGTSTVWPGYVAAIASLVLSLLLLLAILVFAMTQVGNIVSKYSNEIMRSVFLKEIDKNATNKYENKTTKKLNSARDEESEIKKKSPFFSDRTALSQIDLVFGPGLFEIPSGQVRDLISLIKKTEAPEGAQWKIWASTLENDALSERATFRLMLSIRRVLIEQGIKEKNIDVELKKSATILPGYNRGEIIINLAPLSSKISN